MSGTDRAPLPPRTLHPTRSKWVLLCGVSALLVAASLWKGRADGDWLAYIGAVLFGLSLIVSILNLVPGWAWLRLDESGLSFKVGIRAAKTIAWAEIRDIVAMRWNFGTWVFFNQISQSNALTQLNAKMMGRNAMLPDTYGMTAEELATLLEQYRRAYGESSKVA